MTRPGHEPTSYRTRDENANHYTAIIMFCSMIISKHLHAYPLYYQHACMFRSLYILHLEGPSWSHGSWIYSYLCNQCLSPLTLCDKVCQWFAAGRWFSPGTPFSSTNNPVCHNIAVLLLQVALITLTPNHIVLRRT